MAETDDFLSGIGLSEADIAQPTNVYERFILALANKVTDDLRETVNAKARNSGMHWLQSVVSLSNWQSQL
jgi:hypothetical protein